MSDLLDELITLATQCITTSDISLVRDILRGLILLQSEMQVGVEIDKEYFNLLKEGS